MSLRALYLSWCFFAAINASLAHANDLASGFERRFAEASFEAATDAVDRPSVGSPRKANGQVGLLIRSGNNWIPANFTAEELRAPGRLCIRYNNYWCIKSDGWDGEIGRDDRNHSIFSEAKFGARAFFVLMRTYRVRHKLTTTRQIFGRYAPFDDCVGSLDRDADGNCPQGENPTLLYAKRVAAALGLTIDDDIQMIDAEGTVIDRDVAMPFARAVLKFEIGANFDVMEELLDQGIALSGLRSE